MTFLRMKVTVVIFAALAVSAPVWGQPSDEAKTADISTTKPLNMDSPELKDALATMKTYDFGKDRTFLFVIDEAIRQSAKKPEMRRRLGNSLVEVANDDKAAFGARELALRRIEQIGEGVHVEKIEKLLTDKDERLAEMARQAIAGIPVDRANRALLKALDTTKGSVRIGVIQALGERQVKAAVKPLTALARQDDTAVASEAMLALGDIGNGDAAKALLDDIRPPDAAREAWFMAMNDAASGLAKHNNKLAERLYDRVLQLGEKSPARLAAFKGKAMLDKNPEGVALKALDESDPMLGQVARELLVRGEDASITPQLLSRLQSASPEKKVVVAEILGARGDKAALGPISALADKNDGNVDLQVASIRALESLGNEKVVPLLVKISAKDKGEAAKAAVATLKEIPVPEVDAEILRLVTEAGSPEEQVIAIETAVSRKSPGAITSLLKAVEKHNAKVSIAAFKAMNDLATDKELDAILKAHGSATEERVLREGARAVQAVAGKGKAQGVKKIVAAYESASNDDVKASLLGIAGNIGGRQALDLIKANLDSSDEKIKDAAVRALASFPEASAMDNLLKIASESPSEVHRVLAVRAVARLLAEPAGKTSAERIDLVKKALDLAKGADEKKAVIGAMAELKLAGVLPLLLPFVDQPEFKEESVAAILKQAPIANRFDPAATAELLNPLSSKLDKDKWNKLEEALTPSDADGGVIRAWTASKVFANAEGEKKKPVEVEFVPGDQASDFSDSIWAAVDEGGEKQGKIDLASYYPGTKNSAVYLQAYIWSPNDREARIDSGSDDGLRVYLNGQQVFTHDKNRSFEWWPDKTKVNLKRGWNNLVLKVGQGGGGWEASARVVDSAGKPISDLKVSATKQGE